eukprot:13352_6
MCRRHPHPHPPPASTPTTRIHNQHHSSHLYTTSSSGIEVAVQRYTRISHEYSGGIHVYRTQPKSSMCTQTQTHAPLS